MGTMDDAARLPARVIDITAATCPMTMVRTRLALDALPGDALLEVRLRGDEPRRSVPATCRMLGHEVLGEETDEHGITTVLVRKRRAGPA